MCCDDIVRHYPKVVRAEILGYCMGVRRAVDTADTAAAEYAGCRVWTLGPLIHNRTALERLAGIGVESLPADGIDQVQPGDVVIIRAHGVAPSVATRLAASGCRIIDATCPRVMLSHRRAADFASKGWTVIIAGDKNHGEVTGIAGCTVDSATGECRCILVENRKDAESLVQAARMPGGKPLPDKAVLISQTTISREEYDAVAGVLRPEILELLVFDTICPATMERQKALAALQGRVDGVLIIGGKNSANTQRLLMTARRLFPRAELIETPDEIPADFFRMERVGLSAGASTPDEVIDNVERVLTGS